MRSLFMVGVVLSVLAGCAGGIVGFSPAPVDWGRDGYELRAVYGGLSATRDEATDVLDREARRLCKLGYTRVREQERERVTTWGTRSGQTDLVWTVACNVATLSA